MTDRSHLTYYLEHGLSPVRYDIDDLAAHFDRRAALYRSLGLLASTFCHARVLEVAPGSGHNSLYVASLMPREYVLVEPNPAAIADIKSLYGGLRTPHTKPLLHEVKLEDFDSPDPFDIGICENWLGSSAHERALLRRFARYIAPGGLIVLTAISVVGLLSNVLRRVMALRMTGPEMSFKERTQILLEAFTSHLGTISSMTRTHEDWVHDNLMNPAYFGICLTVPMILEELDNRFEFVSSNPQFVTDWRWFKSLHGGAQDYNARFIACYEENSHNFIDYRFHLPPRNDDDNAPLDAACGCLLKTAIAFEEDWTLTTRAKSRDHPARVTEALDDVIELTADLPQEIAGALREFASLFAEKTVTPAQVAGMRHFTHMFGRETLYVSLQRVR